MLALFLIKNCISGWEKRIKMTLNKLVGDVSLKEFSNTSEETKKTTTNMQRNHEIKHKTQSGNLSEIEKIFKNERTILRKLMN